MTELPRLFVLVDGQDKPLIPKGRKSAHFSNKMEAKEHKRALRELGHTVYLSYGPDHWRNSGDATR